MKPLLQSLPLLLFSALLLTSCGGPDKKEVATRDHMHALHSALMNYREEFNGWPESLEDLREDLPDLDTLMVNPITGDNPGYRYTPPGPSRRAVNEGDEDRPSDEVVLVQLRNGEPDMSLKKLYSDGSVR